MDILDNDFEVEKWKKYRSSFEIELFHSSDERKRKKWQISFKKVIFTMNFVWDGLFVHNFFNCWKVTKWTLLMFVSILMNVILGHISVILTHFALIMMAATIVTVMTVSQLYFICWQKCGRSSNQQTTILIIELRYHLIFKATTKSKFRTIEEYYGRLIYINSWICTAVQNVLRFQFLGSLFLW